MRVLLFAIIGLIAGPFLTYQGYQAKQFNDLLNKEGIETNGIATEGHSSGGRRSRSYKLNVIFPVKDGKPVTKEFKVSSSYYKSIGSDGKITVDTVPVKYLANDPQQAIIVGGSDDDSILLWVGPLVAVASLGYLAYRLFGRKEATA